MDTHFIYESLTLLQKSLNVCREMREQATYKSGEVGGKIIHVGYVN